MVYLLAWVKSHQVGDVAVILLYLAAVEVRLVLLEPLLEQSSPADVVGLQLREYIPDFSCKLRVGVKLLGGLEEVDEKLLDKALLVGVSDGCGTVLRGVCRRGHHSVLLLIVDEPLNVEPHALAHYRVDLVTEVVLVAGEF